MLRKYILGVDEEGINKAEVEAGLEPFLGKDNPTEAINIDLINHLLFAKGYTYTLQTVSADYVSTNQKIPADKIFVTVINDDKIQYWVQPPFSDKAISGEINAKELGMNIPSNSDDLLIGTKYLNKILAITSEKKLTNTGFCTLEQGQIVANNDNAFMRSTIFYLVSLALVSELGYACLQYETSSVGWKTIVPITVLAGILAVIGTILDFCVNVWTTSPGNDANSNVFMSVAKLSPCVEVLKYAAILVSCGISYPAGASGNILGVLPYIFDDKDSDAYFYGFIVPATIFVTMIGTAYYTTFNVRAMVDTFKLLGKYFSAPKADNNIYRWIEIIKEGLCVFAFRAGGFAAIAVKTLKALYLDLSDNARITIAMIVFAATVLNIAATRLKYTVTSWSNNDFAYITTDEKSEALASLTYKTYLSLSTLASITMAIGLMLMGDENSRLILLAPALLLLLNNLMAQRDLAANKQALENIKNSNGTTIETRRAIAVLQSANATTTYSPLADSEDSGIDEEAAVTIVDPVELRNTRIAVATQAYGALSATFADDMILQYFSVICCAGSVTSRGLGFMDFTGVLAILFGLQLPSSVIIGIALLLAPPNLRNLYITFQSNMIETLLQKYAEAYVCYVADTKKSVEQPSFKEWSQSHKAVFFTTLYTKAAIAYTSEDIEYAVDRRVAELGPKRS